MLIAVLLAVLIGVSAALQPVTNAAAAKSVGIGPIMVASNAFVLLFSIAYAALAPGHANWRGLTELRPDLLIGGAVYGAVIVFAGLYVFPRLGAGFAVAVVVAAQFVGAMVIDQLGLYGMPTQPLDPSRLLGLGLLLAGAWLMRPTG